jgi:hypothetical protein
MDVPEAMERHTLVSGKVLGAFIAELCVKQPFRS